MHHTLQAILHALPALALAVCAAATAHAARPATLSPEGDEAAAYLFVYFTGNAPDQEQICYALSDDGLNFTPLNGGRPVMAADTVALTGCLRDPHLLRGTDGRTFYMVATDMRSSLGWESNRGIVMMRSTDLVHWQHTAIHFPTRYAATWRNVTHVWAPETVYDSRAGKYMVYFSLKTSDAGSRDRIYYAYANPAFTALEGEPQLLFDPGHATIDGNIVYNAHSGLYHLFYKREDSRGIFQATAAALTPAAGDAPGSQWTPLPGHVDQTTEDVEGVGVCPAADGQGWIVMYDCYNAGHYQFCHSTDLLTFRRVKDTPTTGRFTPRHGTVITITRAEREQLLRHFGGA